MAGVRRSRATDRASRCVSVCCELDRDVAASAKIGVARLDPEVSSIGLCGAAAVGRLGRTRAVSGIRVGCASRRATT